MATETREPSVRATGPDFVGIGVQKSGTTWVGEVLEQHPSVLMRKKEISFFIHHFHRGYDWYHEWFRDKQGRVAGEISVNYIYAPREDSTHREFYPKWNPRRRLQFFRKQPSPRDELASRYPGLRVFAVFRNPVDRAWSHYWWWRGRRERNGKRVVPFEKMFEDDGRWIRSQGFYADLLAHWREKFPDLTVFLHDDIKAQPERVAAEAYRLVGVDDSLQPDLTRKPHLQKYEPMSASTRELVRETYREQIERFAEMTDRDLTHWLDR